jgi:hypothetical protein
MFKIEIDKKADGYHNATITSEKGYLNYMYIPEKAEYKTMLGKINNTSIRHDDSLTGWQKNGKGRLSQDVKDTIFEMNRYFYNNY